MEATKRDHPPRGTPLGVQNPFESLESYSTVFEALTPLVPARDADGGEIDAPVSVSAAFDRCLEHIEEFTRAYILRSDDLRVAPVSRTTLYPWVPWSTRTPEFEWGGLGLLMANDARHLIPQPVEMGTQQSLDEMRMMVTRLKKADPVLMAAEHGRAAQRLLEVQGTSRAPFLERIRRPKFDSTHFCN